MMARSAILILFLVSFAAFGSLKIAVMNDINGDAGSTIYGWKVTNAVNQIITINPDLVILPGDLVGGEDPTLSQTQIQTMWASFDSIIFAPIHKMNIPVAPIPGNHDAGLMRDRAEYKRFWTQTETSARLDFVDATHYPLYYSYTMKNVFFIAMDDVGIGGLSAPNEKQWIKDQLALDVAKTASARIVYGHVPLYSALDPVRYRKPGGGGKFDEVLSREQMLKNTSGTLEEILVNGNVSLTIFGHSHVFYPATIKHSDQADKKPLRVLFMPCIGAANRHLPGASARSPNGYALINVEDSNVSYDAFDATGAIISRETLPQSIPLTNNVTLMRD